MRSGMSFAAASVWMRDRLAGPYRGADAPRALYQVLDDLDRSSTDRSAQSALLDPEPVSTGDERFDALLAGWAEFKGPGIRAAGSPVDRTGSGARRGLVCESLFQGSG